MKNKKPMKDLPEVKLFNKYIDDKPIALAVSGGPDSTAMMQIAAFSEKIKNINVTRPGTGQTLARQSIFKKSYFAAT